MNRHAAINVLTTRLHERTHQGTCADIHPLIHSAHMAGFRARATAIIERNYS